ncbi:MAG: homocysteine methyltransferase [Planctomycetes bacterium]|nr:homocysteine methyltransferase [Planctomycetota bacterium]
MNRLLDRLAEGVLVADGAMGTMLQSAGLGPGGCGEAWNVERPQVILEIHEAYREAGADLITTNTFGGNPQRLAFHGRADDVQELSRAGAVLARSAAGEDGLVLGDLGPSGEVLAPLGTLEADDWSRGCRLQSEALLSGGADAIIVETQYAVTEMTLAVEAAHAAGATVVLASFAFGKTPSGPRTMMGTTPREAAEAMVRVGADVIGMNCGTGLDREDHERVLEAYRSVTALPLLVQPNAGDPASMGGEQVHPFAPDDLAAWFDSLVGKGAAIVGGCCGATPEHIRAFAQQRRG